VKETGSKDGADYIFYGDPVFVLKAARNTNRQEPDGLDPILWTV
jgi:hypothetical protein